MANHDFGSPCDCSECRTTTRREACVACGFETIVAVLGSATLTYDRKGVRAYDFAEAEGPEKELACRSCGATAMVAYYTSVDEEACARALELRQLEREAKPCDGCGRRTEYHGLGRPAAITLRRHGDRDLCPTCLAGVVKTELPDPSDEAHKYAFDNRALRWTLSKIRVACAGCGRLRWLKADNQWKRLCDSCFRNGARP